MWQRERFYFLIFLLSQLPHTHYLIVVKTFKQLNKHHVEASFFFVVVVAVVVAQIEGEKEALLFMIIMNPPNKKT